MPAAIAVFRACGKRCARLSLVSVITDALSRCRGAAKAPHTAATRDKGLAEPHIVAYFPIIVRWTFKARWQRVAVGTSVQDAINSVTNALA